MAQSITPQQRLAANLRAARVKAGISQEELGDRCELHRTEISLLERAGREPRFATMLKLAGALGIDPRDFFAGSRWDYEKAAYVVEAPPAAK
jgi:transcriptional regulator with XRE-family HTH domain